MIVTERKFVCRHCGFIKTLKKGEKIEKCPACSDNKVYYGKYKNSYGDRYDKV